MLLFCLIHIITGHIFLFVRFYGLTTSWNHLSIENTIEGYFRVRMNFINFPWMMILHVWILWRNRVSSDSSHHVRIYWNVIMSCNVGGGHTTRRCFFLFTFAIRLTLNLLLRRGCCYQIIYIIQSYIWDRSKTLIWKRLWQFWG